MDENVIKDLDVLVQAHEEAAGVAVEGVPVFFSPMAALFMMYLPSGTMKESRC